jgi:hypothetical protein
MTGMGKTIDERLDALVESLTARLAERKTEEKVAAKKTKEKVAAKKTKVIYRIQVGDKYAEFDDPISFSMMINALIGGYSKSIKEPVAPEDIRITLRSAPADPESPVWKTLEPGA